MSWLGSIFGSIPTTADNPQDDSTLAPPPPPQSSQPPVDNTVKVAILLDGDADYVKLTHSTRISRERGADFFLSLSLSHKFLVHTSLHFKRVQRRTFRISRPP